MSVSQNFEENLRKKGFSYVAGIDEAGRGPLAGSVVAAAVILPFGFEAKGINDSKKISPKLREEYFSYLVNHQEVIYGIASVSAKRIDEINILQATYEAMRKAVASLSKKPDFCLIDGLPVPNFPIASQGVVKGDSKVLSIAAASILAKVTRDRQMEKLNQQFPEYGFARHKGYATKLHLKALHTYGICPIHRQTFQPVAQLSLSFKSER